MESIKKLLRNPAALAVFLAAILALVGVIYKSKIDEIIARMPIDATRTAEAKLTSAIPIVIVVTDAPEVKSLESTTPVSPSNIADDIESMAVDLGTGFILDNSDILKDAATTAEKLNISLSSNELEKIISDSESESEKEKEKSAIIERVANDISKIYGKKMQALFTTRFFSIGAELYLGYASSRVNNDYPNANAGVVIAGADMNDAVDAAKQASIAPEIISEGNAIVEYILTELANQGEGKLTKQQVDDTLSREIRWDMSAIKAMKP